MQRPGSAGCRVPPQSLTVPPLRAWGLFLAPTPQSLRFPTQASASVPQGNKISLASSERAAQKRRSTFASALGHHPPPHTPLELAEAVGKCRRHLREERRCHSPHPPRNRFLLIKPGPPALGAQSLSHWTTREVPSGLYFYGKFIVLVSSLRRAGNRASRPGHRALARSSLAWKSISWLI